MINNEFYNKSSSSSSSFNKMSNNSNSSSNHINGNSSNNNINEEIIKIENGLKSLLKDINHVKNQQLYLNNNNHHQQQLCNNCKQSITSSSSSSLSSSTPSSLPTSPLPPILSSSSSSSSLSIKPSSSSSSLSSSSSKITSPLLEQQDILSLTSINGSPILVSSSLTSSSSISRSTSINGHGNGNSSSGSSSLILGSSRMTRSNSNANVPKLQLKQVRSHSTCYQDNSLVKKWIEETVVDKDKPIPSSLSSSSLSSLANSTASSFNNHHHHHQHHNSNHSSLSLVSSAVTTNSNNSNTTAINNTNNNTNNSSKKIKLDVGGKYFSTTISTLTKHPDSMLGAMFSSRFELPVDEDGRIFIDRDGKLFAHILSYLRDGPVWQPPENADVRRRLENEFCYYGLNKAFGGSPNSGLTSPSSTPRCVCPLRNSSINSEVQLGNLSETFNMQHVGTWRTLDDFSPSIRSFRMLVSMNSHIYAITERVGANTNSNTTNNTSSLGQQGQSVSTFQFEEYSPQLNNWSIRAPILDSMSNFYMVSVVVGDSIYAIPDAGLHQPVFRYDQADEKWHATETALPTKRTSFAMAVIDDYIYVMGGYKGSSPTDIVERYHPKSNSWCAVAKMSCKRAEFSAAVIEDHIYVIGGSHPSSTVEKFNPHANQWTLVCNLANSNSKFIVSSSAVLNGKIYAIGSENECEGLNIVLQYNPENNQWRRVAPILCNSYYTNSALVVDRYIYFVPWNSLNVNRYESCLEED